MEALFKTQAAGGWKYLQNQREQGWQRHKLSVAFGACDDISVHSDVTVPDAQFAVARAIKSWNDVGLPVRMEICDSMQSADILIEWKFASLDPDRFLGPSIQAHADFPPDNTLFGGPPLPLHFNADFLWGIEADGCFDIETIALHEFGHLLGLIYHSGIDTIMYAALREAPLFVRHQIDNETLSRIAQLY